MSIANFSELKTAVADWLNRDDLTSRIPDFIALTEARLNRLLRIRAMERRSQAVTVASQEYYGLPDSYVQMRHLATVSSTPNRDLEYFTPEQFDVWVGGRYGGMTGRPRYYTMVGDELRLGPTPDAVYTIEMVYYATFDALSDTSATNWLLSNAPDVYLYGSLLEASPFIKDNQMAQVWAMYYDKAIKDIQIADDRDRHSGGELVVRGDHRGV